jgi:hypothetical protein
VHLQPHALRPAVKQHEATYGSAAGENRGLTGRGGLAVSVWSGGRTKWNRTRQSNAPVEAFLADRPAVLAALKAKRLPGTIGLRATFLGRQRR